MASPNADRTSEASNSSLLTTQLARLDRTKIPHKVMTKTAVTQRMQGPLACALRYPAHFMREHGRDLDQLAHFQLASSITDQTWPIKITGNLDDPEGKSQVSAYGRGGWKAFVEVNDIRVGDTLVFSLVGISSFVINIIKAALVGAGVDHQPAAEGEDPGSLLDPSTLISKNSDVEEASLPRRRRRRLSGALSRYAAKPRL